MRVNFDIHEDLVKEFDEIAEFYRMTRAELLRSIIRDKVSDMSANVHSVEKKVGYKIKTIKEASRLTELSFSKKKQVS